MNNTSNRTRSINTDIQEAIKNKNLEKLKALIENDGAHVKDWSEEDTGDTLLHKVVDRFNQSHPVEKILEMIMMLLNAEVDVNMFNNNRNTALHLAIQKGNKEMAQALIEKEGIELNVQDIYGTTPLHLASATCRRKVAQVLIEKGANINISDKKGRIPFHRTIERRNLKCAALFLQPHLDTSVSVMFKKKNTQLLEFAIEVIGKSREENKFKLGDKIIHFLIKKGVDLHHNNFINHFMMGGHSTLFPNKEEHAYIKKSIESAWLKRVRTSLESQFGKKITEDFVHVMARLSFKEYHQLRQFVRAKQNATQGRPHRKLYDLPVELLSIICAFLFEKTLYPTQEDESSHPWGALQSAQSPKTIFSRAFTLFKSPNSSPETTPSQTPELLHPAENEERSEPSVR